MPMEHQTDGQFADNEVDVQYHTQFGKQRRTFGFRIVLRWLQDQRSAFKNSGWGHLPFAYSGKSIGLEEYSVPEEDWEVDDTEYLQGCKHADLHWVPPCEVERKDMNTEQAREMQWGGALCIIKPSAMSYIEENGKIFWLGGQTRSNEDIYRCYSENCPGALVWLAESPLVLRGVVPTDWLQENMPEILLEKPGGGYGWSDALGQSLKVPELRSLLLLRYKELKITLQLQWSDAMRIEYALGYRVDISSEGVPRNMVRASPVEENAAEYMVENWVKDTWEIMCHGPVEVGVQVAGSWYLWTLWDEREFYKTLDGWSVEARAGNVPSLQYRM